MSDESFLKVFCCGSAELLRKLNGRPGDEPVSGGPSVETRRTALQDYRYLSSKTTAAAVKSCLMGVMNAFSQAFPESSQSTAPSAAFQYLLLLKDAVSSPALDGFRDFLAGSDNNRAQQLVADLFLFDYLGSMDDGGRAGVLETGLRTHFVERINSQQVFSSWVKGHKWAANPVQALPAGSAPVCVPVLIANTVNGDGQQPQRLGVVKWLTVELFRDGLSGLIPDLLTLGLTDIDARDTRGKSFLGYVDEVWELSGLGSKGFSGRWRLLNRAPLHMEYLYPTGDNKTDLVLNSISGNSAQAALLVALLAASGQVFAPVGDLAANAPVDRQYLNPDHAITAGVDARSAVPGDPRALRLTEIGSLDEKHGALERYAKFHDRQDSKLRLNTILLFKDEYENDPVVLESRKAETARARSNQTVEVAGLHYNPATTIQDALDAMLECNQWADLIRTATTTAWEKEWCYPRNKDQQILDKNGNVIKDENGNPITDATHAFVLKDSVKTGSLEYMQMLANPALSREVRERLLGASEVDEVPDSNGGAEESASEGDPV